MMQSLCRALRKAGPLVPGQRNVTSGGNIMQHRARVKEVTVGGGTPQGKTYRHAFAILQLIKVRLNVSVLYFYHSKTGSLVQKPRARKAEV